MQFKVSKNIDLEQDIILPQKENELNSQFIQEFTGQADIDFKGAFEEIHCMYGTNGSRLYLLGMGQEKDWDRFDTLCRKLLYQIKDKRDARIQLDARDLNEKELRSAITGIKASEYSIGLYKDSKNKEERFTRDIVVITGSDTNELLKQSVAIGDTTNRIKRLVDEPSNIKTPAFLADWAVDSAKVFEYQVQILHGEQLVNEGLNGVVTVGKGSVHPPSFIIAQYIHDESRDVDLGLVGKGITFDSGGISIKSATNMHYMKSDMGGAAAVLGTIELVARLKLEVNVVAIVAAAENAVDAASYRPGDVIHSYSGKTIEVIDTDAEGRLVLADAISYMIKKFSPRQLVDLATLTGSVVRTLGFSAAGLFTNNKSMQDALVQAGDRVNERLWPMPLYDDYMKELHSDIADIKNLGSKPIAGASVAAKFLEFFTEEHPAWAHLDIAGMAFGNTEYAKMKCATGYGVKLLIQFIQTLTHDED